LLDNMVPRGVRRPLKDRGDDVIAVRRVLGQQAKARPSEPTPEHGTTSWSRMTASPLRLLAASKPRHVFLRVRESDDAERIEAVYDSVVASFASGVVQVVIRADVVLPGLT